MNRLGITRWSAKLFNPKGILIWEQHRQHNLLHYEGEQYVLSAAFNTGLEGYGIAPADLYIGLDSRPIIKPNDTLKTVIEKEPQLPAYARSRIHTNGDFSPKWEKPRRESISKDPVFTLSASATFLAKDGDIGTVNNYFLTTAKEGINGRLIVSSPLTHPFDFWEGYKLTTEVLISLRGIELKLAKEEENEESD